MKTVILCGGKGTRYDINKPKILANIGNIPIIHHVIEIYGKQGFKDFILATGWKGEDIKKYFESLKSLDYNITIVDTGENTNTGGRIKLIKDYIHDDKNFFCAYADGVANIDLHKLRSVHLSKGNIVTITVVRPFSQFGIVKIDDNDQIISFEEKPRMQQYINGGFFIFDKKIFNYIESNNELDAQIFDRLVKKNKLGAYRHEGFWDTLNTYKDEIRLNDLYNKRIKARQILDWLIKEE